MRYFALVLLGSMALGCSSPLQEATLESNDQVQFVKANRGHEVVLRKGDLTARMRLVGVYAFDPRIRRKDEIVAFADLSAATLEKRLQGKKVEVVLERQEPDPRGRFLGYLHINEQDVAIPLLEEGLLAVYTEYPFRREKQYFEAEAVARKAVRGMWTGDSAATRLRALRDTWDAFHARNFGKRPADPLFESGAPQ